MGFTPKKSINDAAIYKASCCWAYTSKHYKLLGAYTENLCLYCRYDKRLQFKNFVL